MGTFAHKTVAELRPAIRARAEAIVQSLVGKGQVNFVAKLAGPLPAQLIAAIRGLSLVSPETRADSDADLDGLTGYVDRVLEARRTEARVIDGILFRKGR